jgi:hypothetical protein
MPEYDRDILNAIDYELCSRCSYKYWEACVGPHIEWGLICCKKVRERYAELVADKEK